MPNGQTMMRPEKIKPQDVIKMRSTLKSFVRDWSKQGEAERKACYDPIIEEVESYFKSRPVYNDKTGERLSILHPGCGLGRLVFEFARRGFRSQGNEFAYFMLISSNFILNCSEQIEQFEIRPYIHNLCNLKTA